MGGVTGGVTGGVLRGVLLAACAAVAGGAALAAGPTLVEAMAAGPAAAVDRLAVLGRTIDLANPGEVRAAIGGVAGLPVRRSGSSGFVGYTVRGGEIIFNPDLRDRSYLGVALEGCVPTATIQARLRGSEFAPGATRTTVALYQDVPFRDRPGTSFSFHEPKPGCVSSFGIAQRKPAA